MGRPDRPLEPEAGPLTDFATDLRRLRQDAGNPTYRTLAEKAHYSVTTLSEAAGGRRLPTLPVTLALVRALGGDESAWRDRWQRLADEVGATDTYVPPSSPEWDDTVVAEDAAEPAEEPPDLPVPGDDAVAATGSRGALGGIGRRVRRRWRLSVAAMAMSVAGVAGGAVLVPPPAQDAIRQSDPLPVVVLPAGLTRSTTPTPTASLSPMPTATPRTSATPSGSRSPSPSSAALAAPSVAAATAGSASTPFAAAVTSTSPAAAVPPPAAPAQALPPPVVFSALTGEDCPQDSTKGVIESGGSSVWARVDSGGSWTGNGCDGVYVVASVDHSNSPGPDSYRWWFSTGPVTSGMCDTQVYIPTGSTLTNPAYYQVYNGQGDAYTASFTIDQPADVGSWVDVGSYPTSGDRIEIRLTVQGWGGDQVAAGAVRIRCQS